MNFSSITWRDVLTASAALLSLTASAIWLHHRWRDRRDERRRAAEHRRAAAAATPDADPPEADTEADTDLEGPEADDTAGEDDQP